MVNGRLAWFLELKNKTDEEQFGVRKDRNTIDAIYKITTRIIDGFSRKEKQQHFFDVKKAFDKIIRHKTNKNLVITEKLYNFIFVLYWKITAQVQNTTLSKGMPQGSVQSPKKF